MADSDHKNAINDIKESIEDRAKVRAAKHEVDAEDRRHAIAQHFAKFRDNQIAHQEQRRQLGAKKELNKVVGEIDRIVNKKDVHSFDISHWLRQLNRASRKLIDVHEEAIDNNYGDTHYVQQQMPDLFGVSSNLVGIGKDLIAAAAGKHTLKAGDFDNSGIADKLGGIQDIIKKIIAAIPTGV